MNRLNTKKAWPLSSLGFSLSEFASDWRVLTKPQSALQEAWREKKGVCTRRGGSTTLENLIPVGAPSRATRLLKTFPNAMPGNWDTVTAWTWPGRLSRLASGTKRPIKMSSAIPAASPSSVWMRTYSQPLLLHLPEQLLMFHSWKRDLVSDGASPFPHAHNWTDSVETCQVAVMAEGVQNSCNGDTHSHVRPKRALANNNRNNSCYVETFPTWDQVSFLDYF